MADRSKLSRPPDSGPGSSRDAWRQYAHEVILFAADVIEEREALRNQLSYAEAENELLRNQVAERKPKGARQGIPVETVRRIEAGLSKGQSTRFLAQQFHVSAMSVSRIKKRVVARGWTFVT